MNPDKIKETNSVLIVDDAGIVRLALERALKKAGFEVRTAESGDEAMAKLKLQSAHALLLDLKMPGMSGLELMRLCRELWPKTEVVIMTAYADNLMVEQTRKLGAMDVVFKPFDDLKKLIRAVAKAAIRSRIRRKQSLDSEDIMRTILVEPGWIGQDEFDQAVTKARSDGLSLQKTLLASGAINREDLDWAMASFLDVPFVHVDAKMLDPAIMEQFPLALAEKLCCLPLFCEDGNMHAVIADPFDDEARREIEQELAMPATFYKGYEPELRAALAAFKQNPSSAADAEPMHQSQEAR
jgi:CheY-like chemotaxis protein